MAIAVLSLFGMGSAQAIDIPALPVVPPNIAATNPALVQQRETLISERKALLDKTNKHNSMCNAVEAGSAADSICTRAYAPLEAEIKSHVQVSKQYNTSLLAAVNLAASQKPAPPPPHTDTSVVDARNVPSGLPKGWDNAIASAYSSAPPGVSDRVRKGFQAVMERDWKVAKAWFQDALNRDPNNAGLKRLVALTDAPQPSLKGTTVPPNKAKSASPSTTNPNLQLPDPNDIQFLFPGLQAMKDREAPVYRTLPDGRRVQMPQDSDMEFLFGPRGASSASAPKPTPTFIIGKNGQLIQVPENSDQKSPTYIKGKDGKLIQVPQPSDALLLFPGNSPTTTPKSAPKPGKPNN